MPQRGNTRVHPTCAFGCAFFFPERRLGLQVVHQKFAGLESRSPVCGAHRHQHNLFQRLQQAHAVNDAHAAQIGKTASGFLHHRLDAALGHAGVVFQFHRADGAWRLSARAVAHGADKSHHRARAPVTGAQGSHFDTEVEVGGLHLHFRQAHGQRFSHR